MLVPARRHTSRQQALQTSAEPLSFERRAAMISQMLRSALDAGERVNASREAAAVRIASAQYELDRLHEELTQVLTVPMVRRSAAGQLVY
ncbi:MAG: hypothetical protein AB7O43_14580 [Hyphomicrobiaceae bacterium]